MILQELTATFGCLNNAQLRLHDGLNVIYAPNEAGKSTWLAFIRTMLYGLPTRERGTLADKNRYVPWNGAAMKGRMDLRSGGKDLVLIRDTVHGGAPMGRFYAAYSGTSSQVEGMTGQNAGELLTGVPRSVYERSALIRQSGLAVDQDAELEKRIISLISSGDETTSYTEAEKRLRAALNQRRHNKTGILPRTEAELAELEDKLEHLQALHGKTLSERGQLHDLEETIRTAEEKLSLHRRMDQIEAKRALLEARTELEQVQKETAKLEEQIKQAHIPPAEHLLRIKFNAANLLTTQVSMNHVQSQVEEAKKQTAARQKAVDELPFAPDTPEAAAEKVRALVSDYDRWMHHAAPGMPLIVVLTIAAFAALAGAAYAFDLPYAMAAGGIAVPVVLGILRGVSRKRAQARARALLEPYDVNAPEDLDEMLIQYNTVYGQLMAQKDSEEQVLASWQNFYHTYKKLSGEILEETASFCPDITNVHEISPLLDAGLRQWKALQKLQMRLGGLRERCAALRETIGDDTPLTAEEETLQRPEEDRAALEALLQETAQTAQTLRRSIDRAEGEAAAIGDRLELTARRELLQQQRDQARQEYEAIDLALETLSQANTELQNRFSPALGRRAGKIFEQLTGGRYHHILLDQQLNAAAEDDEAIPRDVRLLSQGASDQLYLAVRLAICEQVLPADRAAPLLMDDALTNFDDERLGLALDVLAQAASQRQILLFTCQKRESIYLQNRENVHIISLPKNR